ncbi:MAG: hypothetical protein HYV35_03550 [Lentisphaerae bacterium]|nr:hypothetical protein [Lentisphaerota bacterium]
MSTGTDNPDQARAQAGSFPGRTALRGFSLAVGALALVVGLILLFAYCRERGYGERRARQAAQHLAAGDNLKAVQAFARLAAERPNDISALYNLGAAYHNYGWHAEALAAYNQVLGLANEYATRAAHSAARISVMRKEWEQARQYYEAALRYRPEAQDIRQEYEQLMLLHRKTSDGKNGSFP